MATKSLRCAINEGTVDTEATLAGKQDATTVKNRPTYKFIVSNKSESELSD